MKFYRNTQIEQVAEERLAEFTKELGRPLVPPIPIDLIAEKLMKLRILWEPIEEGPGERILGGLSPEDRLIVLNEKHRKMFEEKPGIERSTLGHEMGHWDLFIDKQGVGHPPLPGMSQPDSFVRRSAGKHSIDVIKTLIQTEQGRDALYQLNARTDHPDEARAVNRFAAALSMPRDLIIAEVEKIDRTCWPALYKLAEKFEVTISAMKVRLEQLRMIYVDENKKIYKSKDEAMGQVMLGLE